MRNVLIFTYYWPPAGGPGVQRFLKFSKYLRDFGWEPVIVTPRSGSYPAFDSSLLEDIPPGLQVRKTATFEPFGLYNKLTGKKGKSVPVALIDIQESKNPIKKLAKYIRANYFIPDARIGWVKYAIREGFKIISTQNIDAIITTGPPHSAHLIGLSLHKKTGIPWVADLRDPWTTMYYNAFFPRTNKTEKRDKELEDKVLSSANAVTVVSNGMKEEFSDRNENITVIYNGFDHTDMEAGNMEANDHFSIVYTGSYKPNQDVPGFWAALSELASENEEFKKSCRVNITGIIDETIKGQIRKFGLENMFEFDGFVPHQEATSRMLRAGLLFFVIPNTDRNQLIMPGKMFEYLASRTPMISFGPSDGNAAIALAESGRDSMIDYHDVQGARDILLKYFNQWKTGNGLVPRHTGEAHLQFSRKSLTGKLAGVLNEICREDK